MLLTAAQAVLARGRNTVAMLMRRRDPARPYQEPAAPIRGELLNPDQLDQRAHAIAATHTATLRAGDVRMLLSALARYGGSQRQPVSWRFWCRRSAEWRTARRGIRTRCRNGQAMLYSPQQKTHPSLKPIFIDVEVDSFGFCLG